LRYGIISDIHANLPALERALEELDKLSVDFYLCLGDIVGYGAWPNECCRIVQQLKCLCVRGNHDEAAVTVGKERWFTSGARACIVWTREVLTAANSAFLRMLPPVREVVGVTICHGSVPDQDFYTTTPEDAMLSLRATKTALTFIGHTHYAEWYALRPGARLPAHVPLPQGGRVELQAGVKYLINPGSVGQPRDGNPLGSVAVYDSDKQVVQIHRFEYDIKRTQQKMREVGLPAPMADRLSLGI